MTSFSFDEIAKSSWSTFKKNWKLLVAAKIATLVVLGLLLLALARSASHWFPSLIAVFLGIYIATLLILGWANLYLKMARTGSATWNDFKTSSALWAKFPAAIAIYVGFALLYTLVAMIPGGILMLIGYYTYTMPVTLIGNYLIQWIVILALVWFGAKYQFLKFTVLDYPELSAYKAFKKSAELTKGSRLQLVGFLLLMKLMNLLGLVCFVLGLFVSMPVTSLMQTKAYLYLKEKNHGHTQ